jgi:homopolymeric O-antigen transport system permease protein
MEDRAAQVPSLQRTLSSLGTYRTLLRGLVLKDLKLKYRGSVIGFAWSLANPLLMLVVYTIAFRHILQIRSEGFVFYLMIGLLAWTYFAGAAAMSAGAIADNGGLLKSVWFPRAILPTASVLFNLAQYLLTVVAFLPVMLIWYRVPLSPTMLLFPVIVALQTLFSIGLGMILATGTAYYRDVRHLVDVAITVLFWATPIVYSLDDIHSLRGVIAATPVSPYIAAYHDIFFYQRWPDATRWALAVFYAATAMALGLWLIVRHEDDFAERV